MNLPAQYEVTEAEMWNHYINDRLKDFVSLDHIVLAKLKATDEPVWVMVKN